MVAFLKTLIWNMGIVFSHVIAAGLYFYRNGRILTSEHDQNNPHRPQESDNLNSEYEVGATNSDDFVREIYLFLFFGKFGT